MILLPPTDVTIDTKARAELACKTAIMASSKMETSSVGNYKRIGNDFIFLNSGQVTAVAYLCHPLRGSYLNIDTLRGAYKRNFNSEIACLTNEPDEDDFTSRPTDYSVRLAETTISDAYNLLKRMPPLPSVAPDGRGGLSIQWKDGRKDVRLVVPENTDRKAYIYRRNGKDSEITYIVSGESLVSYLTEIFA